MDNSIYQNNWNSSLYGYNTSVIKCECGCEKVFGKECNSEFHSEWCPKSPNYKNKTEPSSNTMFGDYYD